MSLNSDEVFCLAIDQSMRDWKSFQLSVDQGMGGQYSKEKLVWMSQTIHEFFIANKDLTVDEVVDFVAEIIDNEFNTIIDDGSLEMFSSNLCRYYQLCTSGRLEEVVNRLEDISRLNSVCVSQQTDNELMVENGFKSMNINENDIQSEERDERDPQNDGWITVQKRRK